MRTELLKIILQYMKMSNNYYEEEIYNAINYIADNYPGLTFEETKQIKVIAESYKMIVIEEDEEEISQPEPTVSDNESLYSNSTYDSSTSNKGDFLKKIFR